jgi:acetyl esterase/lipase
MMSDQGSAPGARRPELDQAFQHLIGLAGDVDLAGVTAPDQQWLAILRQTVARYGDVGRPISLDGITFTPTVANGVPAEWVTAAGANGARRIVYCHGGGWAAGSPNSHRALGATLARRSNASLLMVDYRLAPEHRFPDGLGDCVAAFEWALQNGPFSADAGLSGRDRAERIILAGDSAGGNLAAAACVRQARTGARLPDRLVLIAGTLDHVSMWARIGVDDLICTPDALAYSVEHYLPAGQSAADPEVSPVFAPMQVLEKFPPTLLQVSAIEALAYDSKRFAERLEKAKVRVCLSLWPQLPHVWHAFLGLFPEAEEALAEMADFINR